MYVLCCKTLIIATVIFEHFFFCNCAQLLTARHCDKPQNTFSQVQSFNQFSNFQNVTHILEELIVRSFAIFKNVNRVLNQSPTHNVT